MSQPIMSERLSTVASGTRALLRAISLPARSLLRGLPTAGETAREASLAMATPATAIKAAPPSLLRAGLRSRASLRARSSPARSRLRGVPTAGGLIATASLAMATPASGTSAVALLPLRASYGLRALPRAAFTPVASRLKGRPTVGGRTATGGSATTARTTVPFRSPLSDATRSRHSRSVPRAPAPSQRRARPTAGEVTAVVSMATVVVPRAMFLSLRWAERGTPRSP